MAIGAGAEDLLARIARDEVSALHRFFVDWMNGALPREWTAFARCADVLAADFAFIDPAGIRSERAVLLRQLEAAHGCFADSAEPFQIHIENAEARTLDAEHCLVVYEEWQAEGCEERGRVSTALLRRRAAAPGGMEWLHVQETWLDDGEGKREVPWVAR